MAFETPAPEQLRHIKEQNLRNGLRTSEGQDAFERILAEPLAQWIVSPVALQAVLAPVVAAPQAPVLQEESGQAAAQCNAPAPGQLVQSGAGAGKRHARPALMTAYTAPQNDLEAQIAEIWQLLFGIDQIGVHDNFFELGGHSLLATQVLVRLREHFGVDLPVRTIFEAHTVADLAKELEIVLWAAAAQPMRPMRIGRSLSSDGCSLVGNPP
jgi:acyl carrier protein